MRTLKLAYSGEMKALVTSGREFISVGETDYTDIAAAIVSDKDTEIINAIDQTKFGIPIFVFSNDFDGFDPELKDKIQRLVNWGKYSKTIISNEIETAAKQYEERLLPPFFEELSNYMELGNLQFDCPGHQSGEYFKKHPAGRYLFDFYGEMVFRSDICNADVTMGDLLIHEGPPSEAVKNAAKVFNADRTYFVMNGTTSSNNIVIGAIVSPGDLVLFDRNNHKSIYEAALVQCGGNPVYLETARNPFGFIGGIDDHCFDEAYLRRRVIDADPGKTEMERPFRLAVIQLGTYDGTIYNAKQVVERIGHLCDYILFDSAWVGYEQFIPIMRDCSPLLLELNEKDPGIFVTQSVHKQQAGFSQSSYIHKKDLHIKGQKRYVDHKRFNNSFRMHTSTSPFYPIFAALDVNARMQDREAGKKMWADCVKLGIEARKAVMKSCRMLRPFVPPTVGGKKWEEYDTEEIAGRIDFFRFVPGEKWHSYDGFGKDQYFVDPNKFMLTTPGIDVETGEYEDFGIPATILASYLRDNRIIPEKCDFNSILFLLTPAESEEKMEALVSQLERFERLIEKDAPVSEVLPFLYSKYIDRYRGYSIRKLCQEMHDFYKKNDAKTYQKKLFRLAEMPEIHMSPRDANIELVRNNAKLVRISDILGEVALEGALPYPPGIFCVVPGERWNETAQRYFLILEEGINRFPGFSPEIHGVYLEEEADGIRAYGYVLEK
ncbi:MAG TPA: ornithine decarboxylase [Bacillota bacterium]|nr:ornithine decarboxylase [Bacillota bacterium]